MGSVGKMLWGTGKGRESKGQERDEGRQASIGYLGLLHNIKAKTAEITVVNNFMVDQRSSQVYDNFN